MTQINQPDSTGPSPPADIPVNAEPIMALPAAIVRQPAVQSKPKGRYKELSWAIFGGLGPFLLALMVHACIIGWSPSAIDPANLGYSLFALSLAGIIRIVSHGSGKDVIPVLIGFGILQMVLALFYAGSFNASTPDIKNVENANNALSTSTALPYAQARSVSSTLATIVADDHEPSITAYTILGVTGILSMLVMIRFWSPTISDGNQEARE